MNALK